MTRQRKAELLLRIADQTMPIPRTCKVCNTEKTFPDDFCKGKNHRLCLRCLAAYTKASREKKLEQYREHARNHVKEVRERDVEKYNKYHREWAAKQFKTNPDFRLKHKLRSRAQEMGYKEFRHLCPPGYIETLIKMQRGRCASPVCTKSIRKTYHIDHILPLAKGGGSGPENIQLLCPRCNLTKHAKHPSDWRRELGLLF